MVSTAFKSQQDRSAYERIRGSPHLDLLIKGNVPMATTRTMHVAYMVTEGLFEALSAKWARMTWINYSQRVCGMMMFLELGISIVNRTLLFIHSANPQLSAL